MILSAQNATLTRFDERMKRDSFEGFVAAVAMSLPGFFRLKRVSPVRRILTKDEGLCLRRTSLTAFRPRT
jgi:hypothetical protein